MNFPWKQSVFVTTMTHAVTIKTHIGNISVVCLKILHAIKMRTQIKDGKVVQWRHRSLKIFTRQRFIILTSSYEQDLCFLCTFSLSVHTGTARLLDTRLSSDADQRFGRQSACKGNAVCSFHHQRVSTFTTSTAAIHLSIWLPSTVSRCQGMRLPLRKGETPPTDNEA